MRYKNESQRGLLNSTELIKMVLTKDLEMPKEIYETAVNEYECKWLHGRVKIKRLKFGDNNEITKESTKLKTYSVGGEMKVDIDVNPTDINTQTILRSVIEAPWAINDMGAIKDLPPIVANWILTEITQFNEISFKKKES